MRVVFWGMIIPYFASLLFASDMERLMHDATSGKPEAAFALGSYYEGKGDHTQAMQWYKKASQRALSLPLHAAPLPPSATQKHHATPQIEAVLRHYKEDPNTYANMSQMIHKSFDITPYKMNYLLPVSYDGAAPQGRNPMETKFQISFQKILTHDLLGLGEHFALAYTQTSWWQTGEHSTPFRESNYQPEFFAFIPHPDLQSPIKAYQIGLLHESNGQDEPLSRSWNRLYAKAYLHVGPMLIAPRIWYRLPEETLDDDNPDIHRYLGYGDIEMVYPYGKHTFKLLARHNFHTDQPRGAVEFGWSFPLWEEYLFGYLQLFSGYGESLIDYNRRSDRIGVGFALSR